MNIDLNELVKGLVYRDVKKLYLSFLYTLEDLKSQDKITEDEFQRLRKRVLDYGNNCYRNIEEELNNFDFKLKEK
jgi:ferredoxin-fold anticodon binding domain-containing protein